MIGWIIKNICSKIVFQLLAFPIRFVYNIFRKSPVKLPSGGGKAWGGRQEEISMAVSNEKAISDREKALETALSQIERQYGKRRCYEAWPECRP